MTKRPNDPALEPSTAQEPSLKRPFLATISPYFNGAAALFAGFAVMVAVLALRETAVYNNESISIQADMATQDRSAWTSQATQDAAAVAAQQLSAFAAQTGVALQDRELALRETELAPTALGAPTVLPGHATSTAVALAQDIAEAQVEAAVIGYFQLINDGNYAAAWARLTPRFQDLLSDGSFNQYSGFWQTIDQVFVLESVPETVDVSEGEATLLVTLRFAQSGGEWQRTYRYTLIRSIVDSVWRIDMTSLLV